MPYMRTDASEWTNKNELPYNAGSTIVTATAGIFLLAPA